MKPGAFTAIVRLYGGWCRLLQVHPLGTIDVQNPKTGQCYRITGLPMHSHQTAPLPAH